MFQAADNEATFNFDAKPTFSIRNNMKPMNILLEFPTPASATNQNASIYATKNTLSTAPSVFHQDENALLYLHLSIAATSGDDENKLPVAKSNAWPTIRPSIFLLSSAMHPLMPRPTPRPLLPTPPSIFAAAPDSRTKIQSVSANNLQCLQSALGCVEKALGGSAKVVNNNTQANRASQLQTVASSCSSFEDDGLKEFFEDEADSDWFSFATTQVQAPYSPAPVDEDFGAAAAYSFEFDNEFDSKDWVAFLDAEEIMHEEFKIAFEKDLATDFSFKNEFDSKNCPAPSSTETDYEFEMGTSSLLYRLRAVVSASILELEVGDILVELSENARINVAFPNCSDFWAHIAKELVLSQLDDASLLFAFAQTSLEAVAVHGIALAQSIVFSSCSSSIEILAAEAPVKPATLNAKPKAKRKSKKVVTGPVTRSRSRAAAVSRRVTRSMTRKAL